MSEPSRTKKTAASDDDGEFVEDPRVIEVVDEYVRELEAGRSPVRSAYVNRYPELASSINQCLEGLELVRANITPSALPPTADDASGRLMQPLGDFQIVREIARGGMGVVYEAVQLSLGRRVALKVLPFAATLDPRQLQRFKNEAQAAALLHHTHIVPVYAVGCERGVHFYAMQLIDGQSLAFVIEQLRDRESVEVRPDGATTLNHTALHGPSDAAKRTNTVPTRHASSGSTVDASTAVTAGNKLSSEAYIRRVARLIVQAAEALEHAHQVGVVHRDIKPGNLLVDAAANLWITDFGLAQLQADNGLTRSGDFLGTIRYMSPEQTSGQRTLLDHRTDIYSLAATFYELLTLQPVFPGETHQELLYQILHTEPQSPRVWNRAVPPEFETILLKALAKNAPERYATVAEFGADIQRYLDHKPILARKPSLIDRSRKWSRRHPSIVIATIVLLVVVAVISLVSYRKIAREQQLTQGALEREKTRANEAEHRFQQARQAVDALFQISQEELTEGPMEAARRRILEIVVRYYEDFIEQRKGDPASQAELTQVQNGIKVILEELNAMQRDGQLRLLDSQNVRDELAVDDNQAVQLESLTDKWSSQRQAFFEETREFSEEERRKRRVNEAHQHQLELADVLSTEQLERLNQISIQLRGLSAFREPEIVQLLELTPQQRAKIRDIEREMFRPFGPGGPGGPGAPERRGFPGRGRADDPPRPNPRRGPLGPPNRERLLRDHAIAMEKVLEILTPVQRTRWQQWTGKPFKGVEDGAFFGPMRPPPQDPPPAN